MYSQETLLYIWQHELALKRGISYMQDNRISIQNPTPNSLDDIVKKDSKPNKQVFLVHNPNTKDVCKGTYFEEK